MDNDAVFKEIFSHSVMVRALVEWHVDSLPSGPELIASLDLSRLRRSVEQSVSGQGRRFARDMVWQAPFRPRPDGSADARERLLLPLEFQRASERIMPVRMRNYVDGHYIERIKENNGRLPGGRLPPVLPIVLHTGRACRRHRGSNRTCIGRTAACCPETAMSCLTSRA